MDNHRIRQIMTILLQEKKVIAKDLASRFGVSLESIRRDLSQLEQQGTVRKFYGGAELVEELLPDGEAEVFQVRLTERGAEKQAIARAAAALIADGETVYLDSGTTAAALIPHLKERAGLTVREKCKGWAIARPTASFHSLRHTFVTRCVEAGVPVAVVRELVGHTRETMTERYMHISAEAMEAALSALAE